MTLRLPITIEIPEEAIRMLRDHLSNADHEPPQADVTTKLEPATPAGPIELPATWELIEERENASYSWPEGPDEYETFRIYQGKTSAGRVRLALGACDRVEVRGKDRRYVITHYIASGGSPRPIAEFLEVDDYEDSRELIAVIKGKENSPKMYDPSDELPAAYNDLRIETYRDRIDYPGSYNKLGVVAHEDDATSMLAHTLIQAQSRHGLAPTQAQREAGKKAAATRKKRGILQAGSPEAKAAGAKAAATRKELGIGSENARKAVATRRANQAKLASKE